MHMPVITNQGKHCSMFVCEKNQEGILRKFISLTLKAAAHLTSIPYSLPTKPNKR